MKKNKQLRRTKRRKKKIKKQTIRASSISSKTSFEMDDVQFKVFKDGRIQVITSEDKLPEFLIKARQAVQSGRIEEARQLINEENINSVRQMIKKEPQRLGVLYILAMTLIGLGRMPEAEEWYKKILQRNPHWAVYNELANIMEKQQRRSEEMEYRKKALESNPDNGVVLNNYGMHLVRIGRTEEGMKNLKKAVKKTAGNPVVHSNYVFFLHYLPQIDRHELFEKHKEWAQQQAPIELARTSHDNEPDPNRKLRIGYVSPDFRSHSVAYFFEIILDEQNRNEVESFAYSNVESPDDVTARLGSKLDHFKNIWGLGDEVVVDMIQKDKIDILVDLAGHTGHNRLTMMAYKPAPIQVSYLGYPDTTGMRQIDYRLTDELADPPESKQFHTEELLYLPDGFLSYRPPDFAPPVGPLPVIKNEYITFGSFNNNCKINSLILTLWAEVLKVNEHSRFIIKFKGGHDELVQKHYFREFEKRGVSPDRISMYGGMLPVEHLNLYNRVDIALDTFPYNGTTTTFEALWMGVPAVSLVGQHHMSRVGLSILNRFGMGFLAAETPEDFLIRATTLAAKTDTLAEMRKIMRKTIAGSCLCNTKKFVANVEAAYRNIWHKWCQKQGIDISALPKPAKKEKTENQIPCDNNENMDVPVSVNESTDNQTSENLKYEKTKNAEKPAIRLFHNHARSGGTLVCKCIGSMDNVILLSEIHPQGGQHFNPITQAHQWHHLLTPEDIRILNVKKNIGFVDAIRLIEKRCSEKGKHLVIRDWAHLDFIGVPFLDKPNFRMMLPEVLKSAFELQQIALVRHPLDQYLSLSKLAVMQNHLDVDHYLRGYLKFAEQVAEIGYIRYEDFTADPIWQMKIICEKLQLNYDQDFIYKWCDYVKITGDTGKKSRGGKLTKIQPLPRQPVSTGILKRFRENEDYWKALKIFNYKDIEELKDRDSYPMISIDAEEVYDSKNTANKKINAERIIVSSMPRAGSMWTFNVTRELIRAAGLVPIPESVPVSTAPFVEKAFKQPPEINQVYCVKTHYFIDHPQNDENTLVIVPYRDIRDCVVSYMKFMHADFEYALQAMKYWNPTELYFKKDSDRILKIHYDDIVNGPLGIIQKVDAFIGTNVTYEQMEEISQCFSKKKVKEKVESLNKMSAEQAQANLQTLDTTPNMDGTKRIFDKSTGFQTSHITSSKSGQWREILTDQQQKLLLEETKDWLIKHGFDI